MSPYINLLITVAYGANPLRCALSILNSYNFGYNPEIPADDLAELKLKIEEGDGWWLWDNLNHPLSKRILWYVLPLHVRSCGEILKVETIFEVHIVKEQG
jgi:hypothetical protein